MAYDLLLVLLCTSFSKIITFSSNFDLVGLQHYFFFSLVADFPQLHALLVKLKLHPSHFLLRVSYSLLMFEAVLPQEFFFPRQVFNVRSIIVELALEPLHFLLAGSAGQPNHEKDE